jgi:hypothetical protein
MFTTNECVTHTHSRASLLHKSGPVLYYSTPIAFLHT